MKSVFEVWTESGCYTGHLDWNIKLIDNYGEVLTHVEVTDPETRKMLGFFRLDQVISIFPAKIDAAGAA